MQYFPRLFLLLHSSLDWSFHFGFWLPLFYYISANFTETERSLEGKLRRILNLTDYVIVVWQIRNEKRIESCTRSNCETEPRLLFRYTKYIYPYECHMKNLSNPNELQTAIDGNRREGRRSGYDSYPHPMFGGPRPTIPLPPSSLALSHNLPLPPGMRPPGMFNGGGGFPGHLGSKFSFAFISVPNFGSLAFSRFERMKMAR